MDHFRVPIPPAHLTTEEKEQFVIEHIKKAMSVSTTKDDSQAQVEKDAQHEVNQPMPAAKDSELPMVAQTELAAASPKRDKVPYIPPPSILEADKPSSSKLSLKEQSTPPRPTSSAVRSSESISGESEARDFVQELPSQGTQPGIYIQGTLTSSQSLTPKVPTTQESAADLDADIDKCLENNPLLSVTPGALSAAKAKGAKVLKASSHAPPAPVLLSDNDESDEEGTESDDEPPVEVQQKGKRKGKGPSKVPPSKRPKTELKIKEPTAEVKPKRGKGAPKVPFSDIRPPIGPLIFNEDQVRAYSFSEDEDLEIQKAWDMFQYQGWFKLASEPTKACTSLVRDFYKNLNVISSKNPDQLYSSACQLW